MSDFHLLRPEWLLALLLLLALLIYRKRQQALSGQWKNIIAPQLQPYVLKQQKNIQPKENIIQGALWCAALLAIFALSGPSWEKQPSLVYNNQAGLVIALDLSLSMTSQDLPPSRLQRAKYKITDILNQQQNKNMALIAYAGDAHIASPLTRDKKTIQSMLPALDPYIMPTQGSNLVHLVEQASALFEQGNSNPRQLLLVTDGVEPQDISAATKALNENDIQLSILAIGTEQGAPIVKPNGQFFKDSQGNVIMPGLEWENLQTLADASGGRIIKISNNDKDINYLLTQSALQESFTEQKETVEFDQWQDNGYWLVIPVLFLSLFAFRKGLLLLLVIGFLNAPTKSWAESTLPDLLLNDNHVIEKNHERLAILGVENWGDKGRFQKYGDIDKAKNGCLDSDIKLLLSHDPSHWEAQVLPNHEDIAATFSGHTHGMQFGIEIPGFKWSPSQYMYTQWAGLYEKKNQQIYVNRGLGFIGYPGRVGILPEITVFELA